MDKLRQINQPFPCIFPDVLFSLAGRLRFCLVVSLPFDSHLSLSCSWTKRSRPESDIPLRTYSQQTGHSCQICICLLSKMLDVLYRLTALPLLKQYVTLGCRSGILRDGEILLGKICLLVHETEKCFFREFFSTYSR